MSFRGLSFSFKFNIHAAYYAVRTASSIHCEHFLWLDTTVRQREHSKPKSTFFNFLFYKRALGTNSTVSQVCSTSSYKTCTQGILDTQRLRHWTEVGQRKVRKRVHGTRKIHVHLGTHIVVSKYAGTLLWH